MEEGAVLAFPLYGHVDGKDIEPAEQLVVDVAALGVGMVYTLRARIKEIRSGEEDDLGNY